MTCNFLQYVSSSLLADSSFAVSRFKVVAPRLKIYRKDASMDRSSKTVTQFELVLKTNCLMFKELKEKKKDHNVSQNKRNNLKY
jgi:hypothetical protein